MRLSVSEAPSAGYILVSAGLYLDNDTLRDDPFSSCGQSDDS